MYIYDEEYLLMRIKNHWAAVEHAAQSRLAESLSLLAHNDMYAPLPNIKEKKAMIIQVAPTLLNYDWVVAKNRELCAQLGGVAGVRLPEQLRYAVEFPAMGYIRTLEEQTACLVEKIACGHLFIDGNKRTAWAAAYEYVRLQGYILNAPPKEVHRVVVGLCNHLVCREELTYFVADCIM